VTVRKAVVREIEAVTARQGREPEIIGHLIDDGEHAPYGTNAATDSMLRGRGTDEDRRVRFERYYGGYSNGYTFETAPIQDKAA